MDFMPPVSSSGLYDSGSLYHQLASDDFSRGKYDMDGLPPTEPLSPRTLVTDQGYIHSMDELQNIKFELDADWEDDISSTTPQSESTQRSAATPMDAAAPRPSTARRSSSSINNNKKRRSTTSSSTTMLDPTTPTSADIGREKNRIAASKCRRKKKAEEKVLEERRRMLAVQNAILADSAAALRSEVLDLKNEILRHGTCDFGPIQHYIESAASQVNS